jgi:hypothetical protein
MTALLAIGAAATACSGPARVDCPGTNLGSIALTGTLTAASCAAGAPAAGIDALYPATVSAAGTLAYASQGSGAAFCLARLGTEPFLGTHASATGGDEVSVTLDTSGAVLAACDPGCAVTVHQSLSFLVALDPVSGAPTGTTGTLTETASPTAGATCGPCTLPCSASWALAPP